MSETITLIGRNSNLARDVSFFQSSNLDVLRLGRASLLDPDKCAIQITNSKCKCVVLLAGMTNISQIELNQSAAYECNFKASVRLIKLLNRSGIRCLFVSSSAVFGHVCKERYEDSPKLPDNYYGSLKSMVEDEISTSELNTIVRLTKVFTRDSIVTKWRDRLLSSQSISAYTNLRVSPISRSVFPFFVSRFAQTNMPGYHHLTADRDLSYYEFAVHLAKYLGVDQRLVKRSHMVGGDGSPIVPHAAFLHLSKPSSIASCLDSSLNSIFQEILS